MTHLKSPSNSIDLSLLRQQAEQVIKELREARHFDVPTHASVLMDEAADLLVSLTAREREWQPIETVPKDGSTVLLCSVTTTAYMQFLAYWQDGAWWFWFQPLAVPLQDPNYWRALSDPPVTRSPVSSSEA